MPPIEGNLEVCIIQNGTDRKRSTRRTMAGCAGRNLCACSFNIIVQMTIMCGNMTFGTVSAIAIRVAQGIRQPVNSISSNTCVQWKAPKQLIDQMTQSIFVRYRAKGDMMALTMIDPLNYRYQMTTIDPGLEITPFTNNQNATNWISYVPEEYFDQHSNLVPDKYGQWDFRVNLSSQSGGGYFNQTVWQSSFG